MRGQVLASALLLAGCVSLPGATPPPIAPAAPAPCVKYTTAQIKAIGEALSALDAAKPAGYRTIDGFMTDYHNMRAAQGCDQ